MFQLLTSTKAKLSSVNVRAELHGKDPVPAVDLKFTVDAANDVLGVFHPALRSFLYQKAEAGDDEQATLEGVAPVSDLTALRFPKMAPLAWIGDQSGMALTVDYGLGGESNLELAECTATDFKIEAKEGGTVELTFKVQKSSPDERSMAKLCGLVKHDVEIMLTAPEPVQSDLKTEEAWPFPNDAPEDTRQTPEQAFAAALGQDEG